MRYALALSLLAAVAAPGRARDLDISFCVRAEERQPSPTLLRVGPLSARGLLRELSSPLAFNASSDVFAERTGFTVDRSLDRPTGFVLEPGGFGLYFLPSASGSVELGGFLTGAPAPRCRLEGAFCYAEPRADAGEESWFLDHSPWPGGALVNAGVRFLAKFPGASLGGTLGCSATRLAQPGCLAEVRGSLEMPRVRIWALVGASTAGYRSPSGDCPDAACHLSARLELAGPSTSASATWGREISPPGFSPRRFIEESRQAALTLEQIIPLSAGSQARLRLEGTKHVEVSATGASSEQAGCRLGLDVSAPRTLLSARLSWSAEDGPAAGFTVELAPAGWIRLDMDADWSDRGESARLSVTCTVTGVAR